MEIQGKEKQRDRVCHGPIRQPQYHQLKTEHYLKLCGKGKFWIFSFVPSEFKKIQIQGDAAKPRGKKNSKQNRL